MANQKLEKSHELLSLLVHENYEIREKAVSVFVKSLLEEEVPLLALENAKLGFGENEKPFCPPPYNALFYDTLVNKVLFMNSKEVWKRFLDIMQQAIDAQISTNLLLNSLLKAYINTENAHLQQKIYAKMNKVQPDGESSWIVNRYYDCSKDYPKLLPIACRLLKTQGQGSLSQYATIIKMIENANFKNFTDLTDILSFLVKCSNPDNNMVILNYLKKNKNKNLCSLFFRAALQQLNPDKFSLNSAFEIISFVDENRNVFSEKLYQDVIFWVFNVVKDEGKSEIISYFGKVLLQQPEYASKFLKYFKEGMSNRYALNKNASAQAIIKYLDKNIENQNDTVFQKYLKILIKDENNYRMFSAITSKMMMKLLFKLSKKENSFVSSLAKVKLPEFIRGYNYYDYPLLSLDVFISKEEQDWNWLSKNFSYLMLYPNKVVLSQKLAGMYENLPEEKEKQRLISVIQEMFSRIRPSYSERGIIMGIFAKKKIKVNFMGKCHKV